MLGNHLLIQMLSKKYRDIKLYIDPNSFLNQRDKHYTICVRNKVQHFLVIDLCPDACISSFLIFSSAELDSTTFTGSSLTNIILLSSLILSNASYLIVQALLWYLQKFNSGKEFFPCLHRGIIHFVELRFKNCQSYAIYNWLAVKEI